MTAAELAAEVEHLRALVVTLEVRMDLTARRAVEAERRQVVCTKCEALSQEVEGLQAALESETRLRETFSKQVHAANDARFAAAFVELHRPEVEARRAPKRAPRSKP